MTKKYENLLSLSLSLSLKKLKNISDTVAFVASCVCGALSQKKRKTYDGDDVRVLKCKKDESHVFRGCCEVSNTTYLSYVRMCVYYYYEQRTYERTFVCERS